MGLLNKIYGLLQAGKCLFNIFYDHKLEQSEADRRVFRNSMMKRWRWWCLCTWATSLLALKRRGKLDAELGEKFKVKSMVEKFGDEKARRTPASSGVSTLSPSG